MKKVIYGLCAAIVVIIILLFVNTFRKASLQRRDVSPATVSADVSGIVSHLAGALKIKTVSEQYGTPIDRGEFLRFHEYLSRIYPKVHAKLQREKVNDLSLLYTWKGSDPSLKPILLMAHIDVVPADPATLDKWTHPPFSGTIADGFVWGRGSMDMKGSLIAIMEAVEYLVGIGYAPRRTIYLAFGHDEEMSGNNGNGRISQLLASRSVLLDFVLDEGGFIVDGILTMVSLPVALIGIAEKGYLTLELSVSENGGHSSMPERETNGGIICMAVSRLVEHRFPESIGGVMGSMLRFLAPETSFGTRLLLSNLWLFGPLVRSQLDRKASTSASLRTTLVPTMFSGSTKENVIPSRASAVVNCRIIPGETVEETIDFVKRTIDDPRVKIKIIGTTWEPSEVSPVDSPVFECMHKTVHQVFPKVIVAPYLMVAGTDSKHYRKICGNIYRFFPFQAKQEDLPRIHGINERIKVDDLKRMVGFYVQLVKNLNE